MIHLTILGESLNYNPGLVHVRRSFQANADHWPTVWSKVAAEIDVGCSVAGCHFGKCRLSTDHLQSAVLGNAIGRVPDARTVVKQPLSIIR